ncbi:MAG TPA: helix-turn-helix domain-containing protein [Terriglobia bacterium]|nr:helix-turn-helix domain-containing protein [Terriglobia bacterium]
MRIGIRVRELRVLTALSPQEVAAHAGLPPGRLLEIESGCHVPCHEELERLAGAMDIPVYEFFCPDGGQPSTPKLLPRLTLEQVAAES